MLLLSDHEDKDTNNDLNSSSNTVIRVGNRFYTKSLLSKEELEKLESKARAEAVALNNESADKTNKNESPAQHDIFPPNDSEMILSLAKPSLASRLGEKSTIFTPSTALNQVRETVYSRLDNSQCNAEARTMSISPIPAERVPTPNCGLNILPSSSSISLKRDRSPGVDASLQSGENSAKRSRIIQEELLSRSKCSSLNNDQVPSIEVLHLSPTMTKIDNNESKKAHHKVSTTTPKVLHSSSKRPTLGAACSTFSLNSTGNSANLNVKNVVKKITTVIPLQTSENLYTSVNASENFSPPTKTESPPLEIVYDKSKAETYIKLNKGTSKNTPIESKSKVEFKLTEKKIASVNYLEKNIPFDRYRLSCGPPSSQATTNFSDGYTFAQQSVDHPDVMNNSYQPYNSSFTSVANSDPSQLTSRMSMNSQPNYQSQVISPIQNLLIQGPPVQNLQLQRPTNIEGPPPLQMISMQVPPPTAPSMQVPPPTAHSMQVPPPTVPSMQLPPPTAPSMQVPPPTCPLMQGLPQTIHTMQVPPPTIPSMRGPPPIIQSFQGPSRILGLISMHGSPPMPVPPPIQSSSQFLSGSGAIAVPPLDSIPLPMLPPKLSRKSQQHCDRPINIPIISAVKKHNKHDRSAPESRAKTPSDQPERNVVPPVKPRGGGWGALKKQEIDRNKKTEPSSPR